MPLVGTRIASFPVPDGNTVECFTGSIIIFGITIGNGVNSTENLYVTDSNDNLLLNFRVGSGESLHFKGTWLAENGIKVYSTTNGNASFYVSFVYAETG